MAKRKKSTQRKKPWNKPAPRKASRRKLTTAQKRQAKKTAKRAGRPYPNLVDNMRVAGRARKKRSRKTS